MTPPAPVIPRDVLKRMPKVLLHDHLDGGLRPATVIELAKSHPGVSLPTTDPVELGHWFYRGANKGNLAQYLEGFAATCGVMQTHESLRRVAFELVEDLHLDNVVYSEVRFAPVFHQAGGLTLEEIMAAVLEGLHEGHRHFGVRTGLIVCAMRNMSPELSLKMAELAILFRERGCVGFDLAGDEYGHPPKDHLEAFQFCKRENFNITIHAGEAFGPPSIWQALQYCGAHRIGHGVRLIEDMTIKDGDVIHMGPLAHYIRDHRVPLEVCLQSNVHTGAAATIEKHPFRHFFDGHFRITLNTDNRLMSGTSMTDEFEVAHRVFGLQGNDLEKVTLNAMKSAFLHFDERLEIIYDVVKAGFRKLREEGVLSGSAATGTSVR